MAVLTVWRFDTTDGAEQAARRLQELAGAGGVVIQDVATVRWEVGKSKPSTLPLSSPCTGSAASGALGGGFWGLLFGLTFFVPLLGAAIGAASGAVAGSLSDVGIDDSFINRVRDRVTPGTSAVFALTTDAVVDQVRDTFAEGLPAELIRTDISAEQEAALREVFAE